MKKLFQPKIVIPTVFSLGLLAALLTFGDIGKVVGLMAGFHRIDLLWFFLLMVAYEIVRGYQWHYLLKAQGYHIPLRGQIMAFLFGEITKSFPIGNYFQNYILQQERGDGSTTFSRTSAATTFVILGEVVVCILGVLIIGVGSWSGWIRVIVIVGLAASALAGWILYRLYKSNRPPEWITKRRRLRQALEELRKFREGAKDLLVPRVLILTLSLGATYILIAGCGLYVAMLGIGIHEPPFWDALAVYCFSLGIGLVFPLPVDLGVQELGGVGAFLAVGVQKGAAIGTMLIFRILSILSAIAIAVIALIFLHKEVRSVMSDRPPASSS